MTSKSNDAVTLTIGSRYHVRSMGSRDQLIETRGVFKGVVSVGTVDGLAIEQEDGGQIRIIPSHVILSLDILEAAAKEESKGPETHIHYG